MIMDAGESQSEFPRLSIVLPVLNEQEHIGQVLSHLEQLKGAEQCEIIVVDGDPEGGTIKTIEDDAVVTLVGPRGRAAQMNAGATRAAGENLLFLHADTRLPADAVGKVLDTLDNRRYVA